MLATIALTLTAGPVVLADHPGLLVLGEGDKLEICHATDADNNPYVLNEPAINSEGYPGPNGKGHADHTGPIWSPGTTEDWGDIIPPYYYEPTDFHYPGLNWTAEGQAIYENGCNIPDVPPTDVPPTDVPPTPTLPDSSADPAAPTTPASSLPLFAVLALLGSLAAILVLYGPLTRKGQER